MTKIQLRSPQQAIEVLQLIAENKGIDSQGHVYIKIGGTEMKASFALITGIWKAIMLHKDLSFEEKKDALEAFQKITEQYTTYASENIGYLAKFIFGDEEESLRVANKLIDTYPEFQKKKLISGLDMLYNNEVLRSKVDTSPKDILELKKSLVNLKNLTSTSSGDDKNKYMETISNANKVITNARGQQNQSIGNLVGTLHSIGTNLPNRGDVSTLVAQLSTYKDIGDLSKDEKNELASYIRRLGEYTNGTSIYSNITNAQMNTARSAIVDLKIFLLKRDPKLKIELQLADEYKPPAMRREKLREKLNASTGIKTLEKYVRSFITKSTVSSEAAGDFLKELEEKNIMHLLSSDLNSDHIAILRSGTLDADTGKKKYTPGELSRISNFARDLETYLLTNYKIPDAENAQKKRSFDNLVKTLNYSAPNFNWDSASTEHLEKVVTELNEYKEKVNLNETEKNKLNRNISRLEEYMDNSSADPSGASSAIDDLKIFFNIK